MALKIKGITIDLGVDTKQVTDGFIQINKQLSSTDKTLKDIDKGLKLDPTNTELLSQKTKYLAQAIDQTAEKLEEEKKILQQLEQEDGGTGKHQQQIDALKREIVETTAKQEQYKKSLEDASNATNTFANSTDKAEKETTDLSDAVEKGVLKAELWKKGFELAGQAVGKMAGYVKDAIKASSEYADNIMVQADTFGISTDALQEYSYMAELVDTDVSTITGSMTKLTKTMGNAAKGSKSSAESFQKLGVNIYDANGQLRSSDDVFTEIIGKLGEMDNETERDAIAMDVFGKSAQALNPLIAAGADNINAFREEAHQMGYVLDQDTLESLGAVDDAFQRLNVAGEAVKNQIGAALAPVVADIAEKFLAWAQSVDWQAVAEQVSDFVSKAVNFIKGLWDFLKTAWAGISQGLQNAWNFARPILEAIGNFFISIYNTISSVVGAIGNFIGAIGNAVSAARDFLGGVGSRIGNFFSGLFSSGGYGAGTPAFASGGYNLTTNVTIQNYGSPVSANFANEIVGMVNANLGRMLRQ